MIIIMMISTKGRYALRVMADLASHNDEYVSLCDISKRQEVSLKYLEAIISSLNKAGLVESRRGKSGGYRLKMSPEEYTVKKILEVTEGELIPVNCTCITDKENCKRAKTCPTMPIWQKLDKLISDYLDSVTLKDLVTENN